jgi:Rrf2 family protein
MGKGLLIAAEKIYIIDRKIPIEYYIKHIGILGIKGFCRMQISTRGRYGLRAMVDLELYGTDEHVALKSIAERQNISENYLEQLFSALRKGGLVKSMKGSQGGYVFANPPSRITVGDVLRLLEGKLFSAPEDQQNESSNGLIEYCLAKYIWEKIDACICNIVDSITLADLVEFYKTTKDNNTPMYYI